MQTSYRASSCAKVSESVQDTSALVVEPLTPHSIALRKQTFGVSPFVGPKIPTKGLTWSLFDFLGTTNQAPNGLTYRLAWAGCMISAPRKSGPMVCDVQHGVKRVIETQLEPLATGVFDCYILGKTRDKNHSKSITYVT